MHIHSHTLTHTHTRAHSLTKDVDSRPKYDELLKDKFVVHWEKTPVDVSAWYRSISEEEESRKEAATAS